MGEVVRRAFSPVLRFSLSPILIFILTTGCSKQTGPDSNTAVFKTAEQATAARKAKLLVDWQEMAAKIANAERPDIRTIKAPGFALQMSADGVEQTIDLTPLSETLMDKMGKEREPIRAYLAQKLPLFDRARLAKLGFERVRPMLYPYLANTRETMALTAPDTVKTPITNRVVLDLNWLPVVRWPGTTARTPVDPDTAAAWKVSEEQVSAAAMENLKKAFAQQTQLAFETIDLPGLGRYGSLRSDVDPTIILLPEFLAAVRKEWKTESDLVVSFPSRTTVNFLERKNERLLNRMIPEWSKLFAKVTEPMVSTMILLGDAGPSLLSYAPPSTQPASAPVTKPRVHVVQ
jgi:hypothetical protein